MKLYELEMVVVVDITKNDPKSKLMLLEMEMMALEMPLELTLEMFWSWWLSLR